MSTEEHKAVVRRLLQEVWNAGRLDSVGELLAANFVRNGPAFEGPIRGREGFERLVSMYRATYPDLQVSVEDQIAEGSSVVTRWTARGTHRGELMGIAPTGKRITLGGVIIDRVVAGKVEAEWAYYDAMDMLSQLGVPSGVGRATS